MPYKYRISSLLPLQYLLYNGKIVNLFLHVAIRRYKSLFGYNDDVLKNSIKNL
jgi:hypothetical protein